MGHAFSTLVAGLASLSILDPAEAQHCENVLLTVSSTGTQGASPEGNTRPAVSADGRYVVFESRLSGLVPNDPTRGASLLGDLYLRDVLAGTIELVAVDSDEVPANVAGTNSSRFAVSDDGRYVAFDSTATNLDPGGDTNGASDVFLRDRLLGTTFRVSVASDGGQASGASTSPSLSADGRFVAFVSSATNLVAADTNLALDVFVRDRVLGTTLMASVDSNGLQGGSSRPSYAPDLSPDGRYLGFLSDANLGAPYGNANVTDAFLKDLVTGEIECLSLASWGEPTNYHIEELRISADGRYAVMATPASNLVIQGTSGGDHVYLRDRLLDTTTRVDHPAGNPLGQITSANQVSISDDARYVCFASGARDLVSPPLEVSGSDTDIFVHDLVSDTTEHVSRLPGGAPGSGYSTSGELAGGGRAVAYLTTAADLVSADVNGVQDVVEFRRDCIAPTGVAFCFGDGTGTACPCGNAGFPGNGCASSINPFGANLAASGYASVATDTFVLHGSGLSNSIVTYFQGTLRENGGAGSVFGDGLRCAGGAILRLGAIDSPAGASRYPNPGDLPVSVKGQIPPGGNVTRTYQCWYRNSNPAFCTSATFNVTNGFEASWVP